MSKKHYKYTFTSLLMKTGLFPKKVYADGLLVVLSIAMLVASGFVLAESPTFDNDVQRFVAAVQGE